MVQLSIIGGVLSPGTHNERKDERNMSFEDFEDVALLNDRQVGRLAGFSQQWVRQQRMCRRRNLRHALAIDPVYVGPKPRYVKEDVMAWIDSLKMATIEQKIDSQEAEAHDG